MKITKIELLTCSLLNGRKPIAYIYRGEDHDNPSAEYETITQESLDRLASAAYHMKVTPFWAWGGVGWTAEHK